MNSVIKNPDPDEPVAVLIADDDAFTRARIKQALRDAEPRQYFVFHEADWGREAVSLMEQRPYDCVFLNCDLKDIDAFSLMQRLYDSDIGMCANPIILMAARENEADMLKAFRLGAQDYLLKDNLSPPAIHIALNKARDMHGLRRSRLRSEREMAHIRKMEAIGKLTSGVAHDFNNLLSVVMGNITQLRRKLDSGSMSTEELAGKIAAIEHASQHGSEMIRRLMLFSRQTPLVQDVADPNACILEATALLRDAIGSGVVVETALQNNLWPVMIDKAQFQNVLINFAVNARDAMPEGGTLRFSSENAAVDTAYAARHRGMRPGSYAVLTIADTGSGMSEEIMERVFEPFFTTKRPGTGTGLGMSMAYGFIKESGGYVSVDSKEGQGTTFRLYLPRAGSNDAGSASPLQGMAQTQIVA